MLRTKIRRSPAVLMLLSFIFATVSPAMASGLKKITEIPGGGTSHIYFGNYWQTLKDETKSRDVSGYDKEGIQWRVLANNTTPGDGSTGVLLLSGARITLRVHVQREPAVNTGGPCGRD